jgi:hypothetical protein
MFERLREFLNFPQKRALHMLPAKRAGARVAWALRRSSVRCRYNEKTTRCKIYSCSCYILLSYRLNWHYFYATEGKRKPRLREWEWEGLKTPAE